MRVIFLKDVPRVGKKYDVKEVNDGYAINFLIPRKLVELATPKTLANLEIRKKTIEIEREVQTDLLEKNLEEIKNKVLYMKSKTDEKGHLFSGIRRRDIVDAMKTEYHADIDEGAIKLEKPIKEVGEYEIHLEIMGKKSSFNLIVEKN